MINSLIIIVIMLLLSALFSGMEIAFTSKNRLRLEMDRKNNPFFDRIAALFSRRSGEYITTILVGNNIALVIYSLSMSVLLQKLYTELGWQTLLQGSGSMLLDTLISTLIIIFVAEFLPKSIFRINPNFYYRTFAPIIYLFYIMLYPIARIVTLVSKLALRIIGHKPASEDAVTNFSREDLASLLDAGSPDARLDSESELKLFQNALDFADQRVRDCMVPRVDIEAIDIEDSTIEVLTTRFVKSKYSRIFVWERSIDNIIGYVNTKSLFTLPKSVKDIVKAVNYVPEAMPLQDLLKSFIKHHNNIAVVIDEFGGTAGIVSLEDVLEQIFGEIEDEHDTPDRTEKQISDSEFVLSCRFEVKYLNERYALGIEETKDYDTLAGFIIYHYNGIPASGEILLIGKLQITVLRSTRSRIEIARVKRV